MKVACHFLLCLSDFIENVYVYIYSYILNIRQPLKGKDTTLHDMRHTYYMHEQPKKILPIKMMILFPQVTLQTNPKKSVFFITGFKQ